MAEAGPKLRIRWAAVPLVTVHVELPTCPYCGDTRFKHWRGEPNGDGTSTQSAICDRCSKPFKVVRESSFPDSGNVTWPVE